MTSVAVSGSHAGHAAVLAGLGASPSTLRRFLDGYSPPTALAALAAGVHAADPTGRYRQAAAAARPEEMAEVCARAGISVVVRGSDSYPRSLAGDGEAPAVLFVRGDLGVFDGRPRVAVVGTRAASRRGRDMAGEIGAGLAASGVVVVSGLARGIDCAAHDGALRIDSGAPAAAVLGTHHDAPVTPPQQALRRAVAERGVVLSELPPGAAGARWWFAVRNRVMAAVAHVVVVVECHERGGSLHTVAAARARGVQVAAVAGSPSTACAAGTNGLIAEGAIEVEGPADVLELLPQSPDCPGLADPDPSVLRQCAAVEVDVQSGPSLGADAVAVWGVLDRHPVLLETLVCRSGLAPGAVSLALEQLFERGLVCDDGGWWRRRR